MTVATSTRKQQFTLDGVTAAFTFTFRALPGSPTDIKAIKTSGGVDTNLTYTTDFTVSVNSSGVGGTLTLVSASATGTGTLTVYRDTTNTQASDYDNYNQFPANTLETDLDIRTLISQEQKETLDRALTLPISSDGTVSTNLPSPSANQILGWNSGATALENKTPNTSAYLTKATATQAQTGTEDTAYMTPSKTTLAITTLTPTNGSNVITEVVSPGTNQTASGIKAAFNASENLAFGEVGYLNSNGTVTRAAATAIATASAMVMSLGTVTIASSSSGTLLLHGIVRNDSWTWTTGNLIFLSPTTGTLTQVAPSGTNYVIQVMGIALSATKMFFNPQLVQVEHT